jgi:hypothetical protein
MQMNLIGNLTNTTKSLVLMLSLLLAYFFYKNNSVVHNEGEVEIESEAETAVALDESSLPANSEVEVASDPDLYFQQRDYAPPEDLYLKGKFDKRNKAQRSYRRINYKDSRRGDFGRDEWSDFIDRHNNVLADGQKGNNDKFAPVDETNGGLAVFKSNNSEKCGSDQNCSPEELFDVDKYLPQEVNDDWFEVQPEPVSVKNRHLINVTKPIGINTIGTSLKNSSYDLRGTPACPKFVVSPWLQSSIEPDHNLKPTF